MRSLFSFSLHLCFIFQADPHSQSLNCFVCIWTYAIVLKINIIELDRMLTLIAGTKRFHMPLQGMRIKCCLLSLRWCSKVVIQRITFFKYSKNKNLLDRWGIRGSLFSVTVCLGNPQLYFKITGETKETQLQWETLQWQFSVINHSGRGERLGWSGVSSHRASELTHSCYWKWIPLWPITAVMLYSTARFGWARLDRWQGCR